MGVCQVSLEVSNVTMLRVFRLLRGVTSLLATGLTLVHRQVDPVCHVSQVVRSGWDDWVLTRQVRLFTKL